MHMIYECFLATGAYETAQGLADLVSMQDFDVRCDHALLSVSEMPSPAILEGLYKSKLQNSVQLRTVMALYDQEVARNNGIPNYQQLKNAVKLHADQMRRNRNFKARNDVVERGSVTKSQKGNKAYVERKVGECFQWKAHGQCSKGDSCGFSHDPLLALGNSGSGQRRKGRSSSPASHAKAKQTDGEEQMPSQGSGNKRKIQKTRVKFHAVVPHERSPCAPKFEERSREETLIQERCARKAAWDLANNIDKLKSSDKATF